MKRLRSPLFIGLIPVLFMTATYAVTAQLPSDPDLVYVRVTATNRQGRFVTGLHKEEFKVSEDGTMQEIVYLSEENHPLHLGILWDDSGTSDDVKAKVLSALKKDSGREDEFLVAESGKTRLNDAILQMINTLAQRGNNRKRAIVLFTSSDAGAYSFSKVRDRLKEQDIQVYVTAMQARSNDSNDSTRQILSELAELSGGNSFFPSTIFQLENVYRTIGIGLKNQYLIGYRPTNRAGDGKWRKIKISAEHRDNATRKVVQIDVRARSGYYAPAAPK
jgi:Ca-activated chloride channel homolog